VSARVPGARALVALAPLALALLAPALPSVVPLAAQGRPLAGSSREMALLAATPVGALPPIAPTMPTSRDRRLFGLRLQISERPDDGDYEPDAIAGGVDMQWFGPNVLSLTVGSQRPALCADREPSGACPRHLMGGLRYRTSVLTTRPFLGIAKLDNSAAGVLGIEMGAGAGEFGEDLVGVADVSAPFTLAFHQCTHRSPCLRFVPFLQPGWAFGWREGAGLDARHFILSAGIGLQEVLHGVDINFAGRKAFTTPGGAIIGVSITWLFM
jgi:hypothetical protein